MTDLSPLPEPRDNEISRPDDYSDYTLREPVPGRAFYINLGIVKFGTRDPIQGASFFLALALLVMLFGTVMLEFFRGWEKTKELLNWITTPLMLTIGVAIGRSGNAES